ncbi:MAG: FliM/FliN family flagellar motor switch protein [Pseudomonadota bacterium]
MTEDEQTPEGEIPDFGTPMEDMPSFDNAEFDTPAADGSAADVPTGPQPETPEMTAVADPKTGRPATTQAPQRNPRRKAVLGVPIEVIVSVGKARPLLSELVDLRRDSVLTLNTNVADPVEIMIGDRVIARGELQEIEEGTGRLGVRLTEVADLSQTL